MPQVTRADIETKVRELASLLTQFHGWDYGKDGPLAGAKGVELTNSIRLLVSVSPGTRTITIFCTEEK